MRGLLSQIGSIALANLQGLGGRIGLVVATMLSVALVAATLVGLDALGHGLQTALQNSGADDIAIVMRGGSQAEINSIVRRDQVDILRSGPGIASFSPEANLVVDGYRRRDGKRTNISLRGLNPDGIGMRRNVQITQGRWPSQGAAELAIGRTIAETYRGMELGANVQVGTAKWRVVGIFDARGGVANSEIWADLVTVQNLFDRANTVQSVRVRLNNSTQMAALDAFSQADPRLQLAVQSEADYYKAQSARTTDLAQMLAWPLAILMAIGAVVGAFNTMLAAVAARAHEIATLRVIGFRRIAICLGLMIECVVVCAVAGALGAGMAYFVLDGVSATTLAGGITRIGYALDVRPSGLWQALALAVTIGLLGSAIPAVLASLRPITRDLGR
ncbi:MAG: ABC transporter permease [Pseudomonadota bacterium]